MTAWATFLKEQQAAGFPAFAGAQGSLRLPISDALVNAVVSESLRSSANFRRVGIQARADNLIRVRVSLAQLALLPEIPVDIRIERQPTLPASPILGLRILSIAGLPGGLAFLLQFVKNVPSEVTIQGTLVMIDLGALARRFKTEEFLRYLTRLEVTTVEGAIVIAAEGGVSD